MSGFALALQIKQWKYFERVDCVCSIRSVGVDLNVGFLVGMLIEWFVYVTIEYVLLLISCKR